MHVRSAIPARMEFAPLGLLPTATMGIYVRTTPVMYRQGAFMRTMRALAPTTMSVRLVTPVKQESVWRAKVSLATTTTSAPRTAETPIPAAHTPLRRGPAMTATRAPLATVAPMVNVSLQAYSIATMTTLVRPTVANLWPVANMPQVLAFATTVTPALLGTTAKMVAAFQAT